MDIDILTLFPEMFTGPMEHSIVGKAQERGLVHIAPYNFRQHAMNKHGHVDDYPFGGGAGMLLQVPPIHRALQALDIKPADPKTRVILMDPAGETFSQAKAVALAQAEHLVFICGHYEGYDERIRHYVTDEISLGDYILTGGELGAMVVIDATVRLLDEAVGNRESLQSESFSERRLEYPQYTRPREYEGQSVPEVLLSGDHARIQKWKDKEALRRTFLRRLDLLVGETMTAEEEAWLEEFQKAVDEDLP